MREWTVASFTRIYRDLPTFDLEAYVAFLEAGPASEFYAAFNAVHRRIVLKHVEQIRQQFHAYVRQKKA